MIGSQNPDVLTEESEWSFLLLKGKDVLSDEAQEILKRAKRNKHRRV